MKSLIKTKAGILKIILLTLVLVVGLAGISACKAAPDGDEILEELSVTAPQPEFDAATDYMALMLYCAEDGSEEALRLGAIYEEQRNAKIEIMGSEHDKTSFFQQQDAGTIKEAIYTYLGYVQYYTDEDIDMIARVMLSECGGISSETEKACVAWVILNRVDAGYGNISDVVTSPNQFVYNKNANVRKDLWEIARSVLSIWNKEKNGLPTWGRVLPQDFLWFHGAKGHNWFRSGFDSKEYWDYSLPTPYES